MLPAVGDACAGCPAIANAVDVNLDVDVTTCVGEYVHTDVDVDIHVDIDSAYMSISM